MNYCRYRCFGVRGPEGVQVFFSFVPLTFLIKIKEIGREGYESQKISGYETMIHARMCVRVTCACPRVPARIERMCKSCVPSDLTRVI